MAPPALLALIGQCCAALNAGNEAQALRLLDQIARRTGRPVEITSSSSGLGISIVGKA